MIKTPYLIFLFSIAVLNFSRASTDYELSTVDGGGSYSSSNSYALDGSMSGGGSASSGSYGLRSGYAGQIADVITADFSAVDSLNEEASAELSAILRYDDSSFSRLDATEATWHIESGPISSINNEGVMLAAIVYEDSSAVITGAYQTYSGSLDLIILDSEPDNYGAYASDTLPDVWQVQYFGLPPNENALPDVDPDGDKQSNRMEYTVGVDPTDSLSSFRINFSRNQSGESSIRFSPIALGRSYRVLRTDSLEDGVWIPLIGSAKSDAGAERTVVDDQSRGLVQFYKVEVFKQ